MKSTGEIFLQSLHSNNVFNIELSAGNSGKGTTEHIQLMWVSGRHTQNHPRNIQCICVCGNISERSNTEVSHPSRTAAQRQRDSQGGGVADTAPCKGTKDPRYISGVSWSSYNQLTSVTACCDCAVGEFCYRKAYLPWKWKGDWSPPHAHWIWLV